MTVGKDAAVAARLCLKEKSESEEKTNHGVVGEVTCQFGNLGCLLNHLKLSRGEKSQTGRIRFKQVLEDLAPSLVDNLNKRRS